MKVTLVFATSLRPPPGSGKEKEPGAEWTSITHEIDDERDLVDIQKYVSRGEGFTLGDKVTYAPGFIKIVMVDP